MGSEAKVREGKEMTSPEVFIYIYGLFNGRRCRYVGQTVSFESRTRDHRGTGLIKKHPGLKPRVICRCHESIGALVEHALIATYRRRGGCDLNRKKASNPARGKIMCARPVINETSGLWFKSLAHAACHYETSPSVIMRWIKKGPTEYQPETFLRL